MISKALVTTALIVYGFSALALDQTPPRAMDSANQPSRMFDRFESRLSQLPTSGSVQNLPWSDNYWPSTLGGVAQRWQSSPPIGPRSYRLYSRAEVAQLSKVQINALSPAEKFDIIFGDYTYTTVHEEIQRTGSDPQSWFGLCHAIAAAATNFYEPETVSYLVDLGGAKRKITLYSSDVKALLALAVHYHMSADEIRMGRRCYSTQASADGPCWDANPASLYLAVTNVIGKLHKSVVLDMDDRQEVWNSALAGYTAKVVQDNKISVKAAPGTVNQVVVTLQVAHTLGSYPSFHRVGLASTTKVYQFTLELDVAGRIIGGEWISQNRPDFIWISKIPRFRNLFAPVEQMVHRF